MIEYKEAKLQVRESEGCDGICRELNKLGAEDWLLVSPLQRIDSGTLLGIIAREQDGRRVGEEKA